MLRLTDEEITTIYEEPNGMGKFCCSVCDEKVANLAAEAQTKKFAEWLEENTVSAYGGNRIILSEVWNIIQEVKNG